MKGIDMNKTRKKRNWRSNQLSRLNQRKFGNWMGISIYECEFNCPDCLGGNPTHNCWHLPHSRFEFAFNCNPETAADWIKCTGEFDSIDLVEHWYPRQIRNGLNGLFDRGHSWTQLAISRCNELSR